MCGKHSTGGMKGPWGIITFYVKWSDEKITTEWKYRLNPGGGEGGGLLRISSHGNDRMIEFKQNPKTKPKANPQKMPWRISKPSKFPESRRGYNTQQKKAAKICGYYHDTTNPQIVLNIQKHPYLNQATQKNTCQIFPTQNKIPESKISKLPPKIVQSSPSLELRSTPPPPPTHTHTPIGG